MATNQYFTRGRRSEQTLYEDLIIESIKSTGEDVYYCPREVVNRDKICVDDVPSRFNNVYKIEMYIDNVEGFDGEGDLFAKFGVEIRDAATNAIMDSDTLTIGGMISPTTAIIATPQSGYNNLDLETTATDLHVVTVREINNTGGGYTVQKKTLRRQ